MKKFLTQAVFIIPLLVIIATPIFLDLQGGMPSFLDFQDKESAQGTKSSSDANLAYSKPSTGAASVLNYPDTGDKYAMSEPFALKYLSRGYGNPMLNPAMWMNPMTWMNPANYMGLMNPMTWMNPANYMQMMNPMAYMSMMYSMMGPMMAMAGPMMGGMGGSGNPMMNPAMWINPMTMMNPMMGEGRGGNPQMGVTTTPPISIPNVMDPKQYEQWYNEQQEKQNQSK